MTPRAAYSRPNLRIFTGQSGGTFAPTLRIATMSFSQSTLSFRTPLSLFILPIVAILMIAAPSTTLHILVTLSSISLRPIPTYKITLKQSTALDTSYDSWTSLTTETFRLPLHAHDNPHQHLVHRPTANRPASAWPLPPFKTATALHAKLHHPTSDPHSHPAATLADILEALASQRRA
ncbi:hypothetical protein M427DRAFT_28288 [Gonapodya prolifera JEL478]|uniref:Uncharacterized protein n=1 Tax=Gonapodya prolifera (strain JEL478) TaxID=1344416 RepID=A0A139AV42_GONPJ|nr:hypothetical protein M427DRAFT_28288 [Gonapodya prolifera JEL478]|eukprot:KXS20601.1 hypothetical protein M427DRAFT_28288 [Gonapodya prolifera JEL478]